jgi:hypothetical protein
MAKKRASKPPEETSASPTKAEAPAPKDRRKKAEEPQGAVAATSETAAKAATPKARSTEGAAPKGGAKKGAAPIKLNDRQREFLKKIKDAGDPGYMIGPKIEQRTINALQERKLVKRGAKDKESGNYRYALTKLGEKQLTIPEASA